MRSLSDFDTLILLMYFVIADLPPELTSSILSEIPVTVVFFASRAAMTALASSMSATVAAASLSKSTGGAVVAELMTCLIEVTFRHL